MFTFSLLAVRKVIERGIPMRKPTVDFATGITGPCPARANGPASSWSAATAST